MCVCGPWSKEVSELKNERATLRDIVAEQKHQLAQLSADNASLYHVISDACAVLKHNLRVRWLQTDLIESLKELTNSNRIISSTLCGLKNLCKSVVYYASLKVCSERWLWLGKLGCHQQWPNLTVLVLELVVVIVLTDVVRSTFLSFCNLLTTFVTTKHSNFELDSIKDIYNMDARLLFMNSSTFSVESTALSDVFHKPEFSLSPTLNAYCWFAFWQSGHPFKNDWQNFGISCFSQMHLLMFEYWVSFKKCSYTIAKECFNNYETASIYAYCFLGQRVFYKI